LKGIPYVGITDGGFHPGKKVRIQGLVLPAANRYSSHFFCMLYC